jgi:hypothetical protein
MAGLNHQACGVLDLASTARCPDRALLSKHSNQNEKPDHGQESGAHDRNRKEHVARREGGHECLVPSEVGTAYSSGSRSRWSILLTFQKNLLDYPRKQTSVSYAAVCDVVVCYGNAKSLKSTLPPPCIALTTRLFVDLSKVDHATITERAYSGDGPQVENAQSRRVCVPAYSSQYVRCARTASSNPCRTSRPADRIRLHG